MVGTSEGEHFMGSADAVNTRKYDRDVAVAIGCGNYAEAYRLALGEKDRLNEDYERQSKLIGDAAKSVGSARRLDDPHLIEESENLLSDFTRFREVTRKSMAVHNHVCLNLKWFAEHSGTISNE